MSECASTPPNECLETRQAIEQHAGWINNTDVFFDEGETGYDEQHTALNGALRSLREAFANKPTNCEMTQLGEDWFACGTCRFSSELTVFG